MIQALFIVIPAFAILLWLIFFDLDEKKNKTVQYVISFLSITLVSFIILWAFINFNFNYQHYVIDIIWVFTSLSVYPLYYYYIRLLTVDKKIDYRWAWLLLPAVSLTIFSIVIYIMMSPQEIDIFTNEILYHNQPSSGQLSTLVRLQTLRMNIFEVILVIELILTFFFGSKHIITFDAKPSDFFSNIINRKLSNIRVPLLFLLISGIAAMISNIMSNNFFTNSPYILVLPFIIHSTSFLGVLYFYYTQDGKIGEVSKNKEEPTSENNHKDKNILLDEIFDNMEHLLKNEQIFRNPELRINDLAVILGSNRTYISQLIKLKTQSNFSDYINSYRIIYAKEKLSSKEVADEQLTINEIAAKAGFSSVSSFYRAFTKLEETTPAKYRMEQAEVTVEQEYFRKTKRMNTH